MAAHRHYQRPDGSMMEGEELAALHALARKRFPNGDWNPDYPPPNPWMKDPIVPKGSKRCDAISRRTGERCRRLCRPHYDYCLQHRRYDDPHMVGSNQLQALFEDSLGRLREAYNKARNNPSIMALEPVIALYDLRMDEIAKRLEKGDTSDFRYKLKSLYEQYNDGIARGDDQRADRAFREMGELIKEGADYDASWEKLLEKADKRSTRAEKAIELALKREQVLTEREYQDRLGKILDILLEELPNETAKVIVTRIGREAMEDGSGGEILEIGPGNGSAVLDLQEQTPAIFSGRSELDAVDEARGDHERPAQGQARRSRKL